MTIISRACWNRISVVKLTKMVLLSHAAILPMTLRKKTLLIIGVTLVGLIIILYGMASTIVLNSFNSLEAQTMQRNVERAVNALQDSLTNLELTTGDYAEWDDTYNFIVEPDPYYIENNYFDQNMIDLDIN